MSGLDLFLVIAATFRLTWMLTNDVVAAGLRAFIQNRWRRLGYLVGCVACSSVWIGGAVVAAAALLPTWWWRGPALALAASAAALLTGEAIAFAGALSSRAAADEELAQMRTLNESNR